METKKVVFLVIVLTFFILTVAALPLNAGADEIKISSIGDSYIGKEVTVSGVIIAMSSNIEPSTSTDVGIQTFEPGDTGILTIDDGTDTIFVSCDPRLLEKFYKGQRVLVTGIYAGKDIIYADSVSVNIARGYTDVTVKELKDFPQYYFDDQVRIQGNVMRIVFTSGETELEIDDHTGTMDVEYRAAMADIKIGDKVIVEGKFYRNKIYAFAVRAPTPEPSPTPSPTSSPTPSPTPIATPSQTSTPAPMPVEEEEGMPTYLIVAIIAVVAVVGVMLSFKVRDWLMLRRYGK